MSRVGNKLIPIPDGVKILTDGQQFTVKGKLGTLSCLIPASVSYKIEDGVLSFSRDGNKPQQRADHGLARALVNNLVLGVTNGFSKALELQGTGFKWDSKDGKVTLNVGFSHPVVFEVPAGIKVEIRGNSCTVSGIDKQQVGFVAATIRGYKRPEPYKGKGIRYAGEAVRRKAGKAGA